MLRIASHAKVNLFLRLLGKRTDGYHELRTVMQELDLHDEIYMEEAKTFSIEVEGASLPTGPDNLVARAWELLRAAKPGRIPPQRVQLVKHIPVGGGLGGGSSNAVAVLRALRERYATDLDASELDHMAAKLGSDTNFFLHGGTALCEGRGERVTPLAGRLLYYNLLLPPWPCLTGAVFAKVRGMGSGDGADWLERWRDPGAFPVPQNDLAEACFTAYPDMFKIHEKSGGMLNLSGSGSTFYSLHESMEDRDAAYIKLVELNLFGSRLLKTSTKKTV